MFQEAATVSYIDAGHGAPAIRQQVPAAAAYHNIVQDLAWPTPQDDVPLQLSATAQPQRRRLWFQESLLAHTLEFRQMLQPPIKAAQLQVGG